MDGTVLMLASDSCVALFANRDDMATAYADLLREHPADWRWWPELNAAIRRRWSPAGLQYVKSRAWKIAQAA